MTLRLISIIFAASFLIASCGGGGGGGSTPVTNPGGGGGGGGGSGGGGGGSDDLPVPDPAPTGDDFHPTDRGWTLSWSEEFDGTAIDRNKWEVEESCWGGGNDERQCYTDRDRNVEVINGFLRLKAYPETFTGLQYPQGWPNGRGGSVTQNYTSGKVRTRERADWKYGRFSARMKLPNGQGTWPAFWMLPTPNAYGGWAASGEIDIMEAVNLGATCNDCTGTAGENRTSGSLHFGGEWPANTFLTMLNTLPGDADTIDQYHVYTLEWGEGRFNWFVDGVKFFTLNAGDWHTTAVDAAVNPNAPFDEEFYMALNLAVGGNYPEGANENRFDTTSFPSEVLVDWVRVYECSSDPLTGRGCMDGE